MRLIPALVLWLLTNGAFAQEFAAFDRASAPDLNDPHDLIIGPDGRLYVADKFGDRIVVMHPETLEILETFGEGVLFGAHDISFAPDGRAYVAATAAHAVYVYSFASGTPEIVDVITGAIRTEGVLAHSNGRVYVMASGIGELVGFDNGDAVVGTRGYNGAHDVAKAPDGTIWIADTARSQLVHLTADLEFIGALNDPKFGLVGPRYLAFDDFGHLVVADQDAHSIFLIDPVSETLLGVLGNGEPGLGPNRFDDPEGAAVHGSVYYFADSDNDRIVRYVVLLN